MTGVEQVAFENPDGQKVLVVTNKGPEQLASLRVGDASANATLAKDSLTTLAWS